MRPRKVRRWFEMDTHGEVELSGSYTPGTDNYFDASWGNWLPGDPECIEDITVRDGAGVDITGQFSDEDIDRFADLLSEQAADDAADAAYEAAEREEYR